MPNEAHQAFLPLLGQVAVVTGGGRGIGRAIALALAQAGADVSICARTAAQLHAVAAELEAMGRAALPVACDVAEPAAVDELARRTMVRFGKVHILVNNAGGGNGRGPVLESDPALWRRTLEVNLAGVYLVTRAFLPHLMASGGGKIINIGSGVGHEARPGNSAYAVAKAGVWMLTRVLAQEVWQHGIEVNEIVPGPVATALTAGSMRVGAPPPFAESERVKPPEEVAELALWLATRPRGGPTAQSFSLARRPI